MKLEKFISDSKYITIGNFRKFILFIRIRWRMRISNTVIKIRIQFMRKNWGREVVDRMIKTNTHTCQCFSNIIITFIDIITTILLCDFYHFVTSEFFVLIFFLLYSLYCCASKLYKHRVQVRSFVWECVCRSICAVIITIIISILIYFVVIV